MIDDRLLMFMGIAVTTLVFVYFVCKNIKRRHIIFRWRAGRALKKLARLQTPQSQYYLLRSINPFVLEEMVLTALKRGGHKIIRNKRYTGDGGIDGRVFINQKLYFIQTKRYRAHINPGHVEEFVALCRNRGVRGLFVHTGKTGPKSRTLTVNTDVQMISGDRLLNMLLNRSKQQQNRHIATSDSTKIAVRQ